MFVYLFLAFVGVVAGAHLICTAAKLSSTTPFSVVVEVAVGFGSAVGIVVTALHGDPRALMFMGALACSLLLFSIERALRKSSDIFSSEPVPWMRKSSPNVFGYMGTGHSCNAHTCFPLKSDKDRKTRTQDDSGTPSGIDSQIKGTETKMENK